MMVVDPHGAIDGRGILRSNQDRVIESDGSRLDWGARCGDWFTRGKWSEDDLLLHINCFELLAGSFVVKC